MKNFIKFLGIAVIVAVIGFSMTGCAEPGLELSGTTWVLGYTKADLAEAWGSTEALVDQTLALAGITINFPIPVMQIAFTSDKDFTMSQNTGFSSLATINTPKWEVVLRGTYTISGDDVTLSASGYDPQTCTVDGNTLTITDDDGTTMKFQKQ